MENAGAGFGLRNNEYSLKLIGEALNEVRFEEKLEAGLPLVLKILMLSDERKGKDAEMKNICQQRNCDFTKR